MKVRATLLSIAVLVSGVYIVGCELEEECDPTVTTCETTDTGGTDTGTDDTAVEFQTYNYVLIEDQEPEDTSSATGTAGVDIDAVELNTGVDILFASQIHECTLGGGEVDADARNCNLALGAPQNGCSPSDPDFVSLGGFGGTLIVSFGSLEEIETGDSITVYECGRDQNPAATDENFNMLVGVATTSGDTNWVSCITNGTGITNCTVPNLPQIPIN